MRYFKILLPLLILGISCNSGSNRKYIDNSKPYFNIQAFLEKEIQEYKLQNYSVSRTLSKNDILTNAIITQPDWQKEFQLFINLDINKPGIVYDYKVDTLKESKGTYLFYENISGKKPIKQVKVIINNQSNIDLIEIVSTTQTYFKEEEFVYYVMPGKSYGFSGKKKRLWGEENTYEVHSQLIR